MRLIHRRNTSRSGDLLILIFGENPSLTAQAADLHCSPPSPGMSVAVPRPVSMSTPKPAPSAAASSSKSAPKQPVSRAPPRIAAPLQGKDLSSSTGKIFARPSKEWVLPERAKPGRKAATDEPDNKRQSQNRLSQRAHRARRTDYIATLEQRLRQYEQDEIHSNVRLQEVARALKQDNEKLKAEVGRLTQALGALRAERDAWNAERRVLNDTIRQLRGGRISTSPTTPYAPTPRSIGIATPTMQPARVAVACPICPDPDPDCPCQQGAQTMQSQDPTLAPLPPITASSPSAASRNTWNVADSNSCGFCDLAPEACLCRDVKPVISRSPSPIDDCGLCTNDSFCACRAGAAAAANSSPATKAIPLKSLLAVALPPTSAPSTGIDPRTASTAAAASAAAHAANGTSSIQIASAAVPLKRKAKADRIQSVWSLDNVKARTARTEAVCTGDPSNCDACRNDTFGREFCGHLFNRPHECNGGCASSSSSSGGVVEDGGVVKTSCCGAPELCGQHSDCGPEPTISNGPTEGGSGEGSGESSDEVMRPDLAWRTLKAHPNAKFAPLAMLADVVARRHKVHGPRVELSPSPPPPTMREIQTSAVKDALRWLDGQKRAPEGEGEEPNGKRRRMWQ